MMRTTLLLTMVLLAGLLPANKHADTVKDLGDETKRAKASETLSKAGAEAFDALIDGLKTERTGEGEELRRNSQIRLACARLLGVLADSRAGSELLRLFKAEPADATTDPEFTAACALALGQVWADQIGKPGRSEAVAELTRAAQYENVPASVVYGCLGGLSALREGGEVGERWLKEGKEIIVRSAAIGLVVACGHKAAADDMLEIWLTQRLGPTDAEGKRSGATAVDYTKPLGLQALFGLASFGDARCVDGLIDVATMNEFYPHQTLRKQATDLMKGAALKGPALEAMKAVLKADDKRGQWRQVAIAMGEIGPDGVQALLEVAEFSPADSTEKPYMTRVDEQLGSLTSEVALRAFVAAYESIERVESNKAIRERILTQLLNYRTSLKGEGVYVFKAAANDESLEAPKRAQAINAYCESRGIESFSDLQGWLKVEDAVIRAQAVQNMGRTYIPITRSKDLLLEAMKSTGEGFEKVRQNALQGLQRSEDKALLQVFLDAMDPEKEPSPDVRRESITAIQTWRRAAKVKEEDVLDAIKSRTKDPDANVRAQAVSAAASIAHRVGQGRVADEIVEAALKDTDKNVRIAAYGQAGVSAREVKLESLVEAALKEDASDTRAQAVQSLSQMTSLSALSGQQENVDRLVDMALIVAETQNYSGSASRSLLKKLAKEAGAFAAISRKTLAAIDRNYSETNKMLDRVSALVPILTEIEEEAAMDRVKKLAEEPNVDLRRNCAAYIGALGRAADIPFLRTLRDKTDNAATQVQGDINAAIQRIEDSAR